MKLSRLVSYSSFILLLIVFSCKELKGKNEFTGTYKIHNVASPDSILTTPAQQALDWKIILKDSNNFHIYGPGKNMMGYWNIEMNERGEYKLLFQSGGLTTYARFNGTKIYFDKQEKMLDSLFSRMVFIKTTK